MPLNQPFAATLAGWGRKRGTIEILPSAATQHLAVLGRHAAKRTVRLLLDPLRRSARLPLARGKPDAAALLAGTCRNISAEDFRHSFRVTEPIPEDEIEVPHRRIANFHLLLDTRNPGFSCRNNVVIGPGNAVLYEDGIPFEEMSVGLQLLEVPRRVRGTVGYLANTDPPNYYHWLVFSLPLLGSYRERLGLDPDYCYVGHPARPFHAEALARAGIGAERVVSHAVAGDRLVADFVDRGRGERAVDRAMLAFTRGLFFRPTATPPTRRLFIGRRGATRRRVLNEDQLCQHAARHGFERLELEGRSIAEQARLFAEAAFVIAPHGAALTNLLFATPQASVLELLPPRASATLPINAPNLPAFREISAFVGCRYDYLFGEPDPLSNRVNRPHADFSVSFAEFCWRLETMLTR